MGEEEGGGNKCLFSFVYTFPILEKPYTEFLPLLLGTFRSAHRTPHHVPLQHFAQSSSFSTGV